MVDRQAEPGFSNSNVAENYREWVAGTMKMFSYKRKSQLFDRMKSCSVEVMNGTMTIFPSHHEKGGAWSREGLSEEDNVILSFSSSPSAVGAALRLALERCRGNVY
jgi:hypothetical protein